MPIHFKDLDGRYLCNKAVSITEEKTTINPVKVTCKNCNKIIEGRCNDAKP